MYVFPLQKIPLNEHTLSSYCILSQPEVIIVYTYIFTYTYMCSHGYLSEL